MPRFFSLIALFLLPTAAALGQIRETGEKLGIAELYLAKDDGSGRAGAPADGFLPTDVPIYCVVQLDSPRPTTVKMFLVAVNVPGVRPETRVVATSYTTRDNQDRVNFTGRPDGRWVTGRYRVDIYIGDVFAASRDFTVQKTRPPRSSAEGVAEPKPDSRPRSPARRVRGT